MSNACFALVVPALSIACAAVAGDAAQERPLPGSEPAFSANEVPGAVPLLLPLALADYERMGMLGAGCLWRAADEGPAVLVLKDTGAAAKIDGLDVKMAPDAASPELPEGAYGVRTAYSGPGLSIAVRRASGGWKNTGPETREASADLAITTANGSGKMEGGVLTCGA